MAKKTNHGIIEGMRHVGYAHRYMAQAESNVGRSDAGFYLGKAEEELHRARIAGVNVSEDFETLRLMQKTHKRCRGFIYSPSE